MKEKANLIEKSASRVGVSVCFSFLGKGKKMKNSKD